MSCFIEEILLCTSCHHMVSSKEILSGHAYCHPILEVLICKKCNNRLSSTAASESNKLCLWCGFPGRYTTCIECSSNFCVKCLKNNFNKDTFKNITKKKNWICFHCLPETLSRHKARCAKVLGRMGKIQSLPLPLVPTKRKRSNSDNHMRPSKKHRCTRENECSSDDELPKSNDSCATNEKGPSAADFRSTKKEIIEKASQLSMLFFEVNQRALKFKNKLENQSCTLKVLQNAFTFKNDLLDVTIKTLKVWKEELSNTRNRWEQEFDISLIVPVTENAESKEDENLNSNNFRGKSGKHGKRKKFNLSLKKTLESENTDDGTLEDIKESSVVAKANSTLCDEDILLESEDDAKTEVLEITKEVPEAKQNYVPVIPEIVAPEVEDEDSNHGSIFSAATEILNFDELQPDGPLLEDIKDEVDSYNEEPINTEKSIDKMMLHETTDFAAASSNSDISQTINNLCDNPEMEEEAASETSFVFDINVYRSKSPTHFESHDSDAAEVYDLDVAGGLNTVTLLDDEEKSQSQCTTEIDSENEIAPSKDVPQSDFVDTIDVHSSNSETPNNNEVTSIDEQDNAANKQNENTDMSKINDEEILESNNEVLDIHEPIAASKINDNEEILKCNTEVLDIPEPIAASKINDNEEILKCNNEVSDMHESIAAPNKENIENNDQLELNDNNNIDDVIDNSKLATSNDPCCSNNENSNELKIDKNDIEIEDIVITPPDIEMDIKETPLIKIDISEVTKAKIDFFDGLGLYTNIVGANANHIKEDIEIKEENIKNEDYSKNIKDALKLLKLDDCDLFDSDSDTSVSSVSDDEEEEEENKIKKDKDAKQPGLINKEIPVLPKEAIIVTNNSDKEVSTNKADVDNVDTGGNEEDPDAQIKSCTVMLDRLENILLKQCTAYTSENSELKEIDRLTNLDNLDLKRKDDESPKKSKSKRRKIIKPSGSPASKSETDDSDNDDLSLSRSSAHSPVMSDISCEGMLDALINFDGSASDFDMDSSSKESDCEDGDGKKKKRKKRTNSTESNKENQPDNKENDKSTAKELTAEELALAEKRKWRNDPLLRLKLTESGSETDSDGTVEGENILSEKTKKKMEALEEKMEKGDTRKVKRKTSFSSEHKSENETDKDVSFSSEIDDDDAEDVKPSIIINTDTDSDIEFISEMKKRSPGKSSKPKTSICISSDENDTDWDGEDESGSKKKGRKNIRAILSDETLEEATKRATMIEKQRSDRLDQKHQKMESMLTQSQTLSQEEGLILDVNEETQTPLIVVNSHITKRLKNHQKKGVSFMWESCYEGVKQMQKDNGSGCIIAHCMGLGKTFQVVALIHTLFAHPITNTKHVVVVCPLSVVLNWKNEFKQGMEGLNDNVNINIFCISDRYTGLHHRLFIVEKWRQATGVLIMGYEAYERLTNFTKSTNKKRDENIKKALVDPGPDLVVLDEGHLLKNGKNLRTKALMKVKTKRRIVLTGTPLQNNLKEYYHMVQFVKPNLLGNYTEYANRFVNPIMNGQYHDSTEEDFRRMKKRSHCLNKMLRNTIQRYEVTELQSYLPSKSDYVLFIQPHIIQAQLYEKYLDILKTETGVVKGSLFNNYHKLHSLWTHPCLLHLKQEQKKSHKKSKEMDVINLDPEINDTDESPDGWWHGLCPDDFKTNIEYGPKFKVMLSIIQECEKIGDKMLIFSSSLLELDAIESFLQQHATPTSQWKPKEDYFRMDGTVLPDVRLQQCDAFNDKNNTRTRVFLISNRVGGLGLNLVAANRVILMDVNWNPAYDSQSVFRTYRFGQTKECFIYRLVSMGTMEEVVYQRQINKLAIAGRVVDEMQITRHYKSDDLQKMYRLEYNIAQERPNLAVPPDTVLATAIRDCEEIFKYHEHQSLLENKPEEELDEDEMKLAWDEFNKENENHNRQIEEQKRRLLAQQAGPSSFLPKDMALPLGIHHMNFFKNNPNFKLPMQSTKVPPLIPYKTTNSTKTKEGAAQPEPHFEVVFVNDGNRQAFNAEETVEFRKNHVQQQNLTKTGKPNELSKQFYDYIKQFSHEAATATIRKLATPQPGGVNQPNVSHTPNTTQAQNKKDVVMPQILNTFTQSQVKTNVVNPNRGYVLPDIVRSFVKDGRATKSYGGHVAPLNKNSIQKTKTQAASSYTVPKHSKNTNLKNSSIGNNKPNNIQIVRKTHIVSTPAKAQSAMNVNTTKINTAVISKIRRNNKPIPVVDLKNVIGKTQAVNVHTKPQLSTSKSKTNSTNTARLPKIGGNAKPTALININDVVQEIRTVNIPTDLQPPIKTKNKTNTSNAVVTNDNLDVIDVDSLNISQQEELIKSLNKNMDITLSVLDKPNQNAGNNILESPKIKVNGGSNAISISAIPRNNLIQSNPNDVIEID